MNVMLIPIKLMGIISITSIKVEKNIFQYFKTITQFSKVVPHVIDK